MLDYAPMYKRVLLKISGEQLAGAFDVGIDPKVASYFADEVKKVIDCGVQVAIVVGGGNMARGAEVAKHGIRRVTGDHMGMLAGLINSIAMTDIFEARGIQTRCLSNVFADQVAEMYSFRRADKHLAQGRVVIVAGGTGRPYFTHDTAAINIGLELSCDVVLKATKVDGVYNKDPLKFSDAKKIDELHYKQAVEDGAIMVMDKAALGLAMEQNMPVVIYESMVPDNLLKVIQGKKVGTTVK
jgi:uridylate kinase